MFVWHHYHFLSPLEAKLPFLRPSLCSDLEIYIAGLPLLPSTCYTHVKDRHFCGMPTVHHSYMLSSDWSQHRWWAWMLNACKNKLLCVCSEAKAWVATPKWLSSPCVLKVCKVICIYQFCVHYGVLVHEGRVVTVKGGIMHGGPSALTNSAKNLYIKCLV